MNRNFYIILLYFIPSLLFSQSFEEVGEKMGIKHIHTNGVLMGGGVAFTDFDNDGFEDMFFTGGSSPNKMYRNLYGDRFINESNKRIGEFNNEGIISTGVLAGDIDNDGYQDLIVLTERSSPIQILKNDKGVSFINMTKDSNIKEKAWSTGAVMLDVNADGLLDIYVINYIKTPNVVNDENGNFISFEHECYPNLLYVNQGDWTFKELADEYNVADLGCGLSVATVDFDSDGDSDIYIANDFGEWIVPNRLYINNNGIFSEFSTSCNLDAAMYGMGIALLDHNADGIQDYYVTNIGKNELLISSDNNHFESQAESLNVMNTYAKGGKNATGWGVLAFDYNNDFFTDLYIANGYIDAVEFLNTTQDDSNVLFQGNSDNTFSDVSAASNIDDASLSRGTAYSDWDNDGDLDLAVANVFLKEESEEKSYSNKVYLNNLESNNNWIEFVFQGNTSNRDAIGALASIYTVKGEVSRQVNSGSSHASSNSKVMHLGLGDIEKVDQLVVKWPMGLTTTINELEVNKKYLVVEGENEVYKLGCMDIDSKNFDPKAEINSGCVYDIIYGCIDTNADNYNSNADLSDGSCTYSNVVTSLPENLLKSGLRVYPNPFSGYFNVEANSKHLIKLYALTAQSTEKSFEVSSGTTRIDTSELAAGLYKVSIYDIEKNIWEYHSIVKL